MYSSNAGKDYEAVNRYHKPHHEYGKIRPDDNYGRKMPVVELEPLMESVPLKRDYMDFGIRGFWVVGEGRSHHSDTDADTNFSFRMTFPSTAQAPSLVTITGLISISSMSFANSNILTKRPASS